MTAPLPVIWHAFGDAPARGYWDQTLLEDLLAGRLWRPPGALELVARAHGDVRPDAGAVMVIPGRYAAAPHTARSVARQAEARAWALVILTSDEESTFPVGLLPAEVPVWQMTPPLGPLPANVIRVLGEGYTPHVRDALDGAAVPARRLDVSFAGQVTHERRRAAVRALQRAEKRGRSVDLVATESFTAGLPGPEYAARLAESRVVLCPSGPATPSSFRVFEALEAGAVPIADDRSPASDEDGYWERVLPGAPFPVISDWGRAADHAVDAALEAGPRYAARCSAWWQAYKRDLAYDLCGLVAELSEAPTRPPASMADCLTVIVTASPIRSHPDTAILEETVESVLAHPALAGCEILVGADGIRPEQTHLASAYDEWCHRLTWLTEHRWPNALPVLADPWLHQAGLTRLLLAEVRTPLVLFLEHDTPLVGEVPWWEAGALVRSGRLDLLRLYHEGVMPAEHRHLMLDPAPVVTGFVPVIRTRQWSQRPHIASTAFYRRILRDYFGPDARTMIEDVMHGVVDSAVELHGSAGWDRFKIGIYAPPGDMRRSGHSDGRAGEPKYPMVFAYDGDTPEGAPRATAERLPEER